jgi:hypothetical protein
MGEPPEDIKPDFWYNGWPAYESNPRAQYEDARLCSINRDLIGRNWRVPEGPFLDYAPAVEDLMEERALKHKLWGLKDPALCFTAGIFANICLAQGIECGVITIERDFDDVVASLMKRDVAFPKPVAQHIACTYWLAWHSFAGDYQLAKLPLVMVNYKQLLEKPEKVVTDIANWLYDTPPDIQKAINHIDPGLNHGKTS